MIGNHGNVGYGIILNGVRGVIKLDEAPSVHMFSYLILQDEYGGRIDYSLSNCGVRHWYVTIHAQHVLKRSVEIESFSFVIFVCCNM